MKSYAVSVEIHVSARNEREAYDKVVASIHRAPELSSPNVFEVEEFEDEDLEDEE